MGLADFFGACPFAALTESARLAPLDAAVFPLAALGATLRACRGVFFIFFLVLFLLVLATGRILLNCSSATASSLNRPPANGKTNDKHRLPAHRGRGPRNACPGPRWLNNCRAALRANPRDGTVRDCSLLQLGAQIRKEDVQRMRRYETIFILRPDSGDPQIKEAIKRYEGIIAAGAGEMIETEEWGSRELAYKIKGERRGFYVRMDYVSPGPVMNEVERNLRISDTVLRYLSVLVDDDADVAKAREELEARNRRIAEAKAAQEARTAALMASREERAEEAPDAPEEIMEAAVEEIAGPEGDREPD